VGRPYASPMRTIRRPLSALRRGGGVAPGPPPTAAAATTTTPALPGEVGPLILCRAKDGLAAALPLPLPLALVLLLAAAALPSSVRALAGLPPLGLASSIGDDTM
jgi:hypothetical protein